ncbi:uncharacterized protein PSFLO_04036 [Pseudozyma flocculosa]|uniref:Polyketide synthase n=1 Tax=Pseudozyma flocculosa TaxID=84751 RepID=A0A5C3F256_9BASI|nr:uncharacterized protein PSFLO_04036 [Pseudozyma flocculosa]
MPAHLDTVSDETLYTNAAFNGAIVAAGNVGLILEALDRDESPLCVEDEQVYAGYCTGVLAALALAGSGLEQPMEIVQSGVEAVRLAFFVGLRGQQAASPFLDPLASPSQHCWSIGVSGADLEAVQGWTDTFNQLHGLDAMSKLDVSAVTGASNVTVSGPPEYLDEFVKHCQGQASPQDSLSFTPFHIYSSYHSAARGLQIKIAVKGDMQSRQIRFDLLEAPQYPVLSSKDGAPIAACEVKGSILDQALDIMLIDVCRWDLVSKAAIAHAVGGSDDDAVAVVGAAFSTALARDIWSQARKAAQRRDLALIDLASPHAIGNNPSRTISPQDGEEIVVVSMACRFPGGVDSPEKYWDLLSTGRSAIGQIPRFRFDIDQYFGTGSNQTQVRHMGAIQDPELFDCRLFNISPKEAEQKDPGHRMMAMACYEALEQAGYVPNVCPTFDTKRIGCFLGASSDDYRENASSNIGSYFITGNIRAFVPGAISYNNTWEGPSNSIDTGDSSSSVAIEHAVNALRAHQCDSALAGGVTFITQPQMFIGMDKDGLLSHGAQNRTFCSGNDGAVRGDGVGVLLLKRLSDAVAEGDNILATIAEVGTSFSASLTDEAALGELFQQTCRKAGVRSDDVVHVEASGHHTVGGERAELEAIVASFGCGNTISVGSVRPNVGACEAASGVASVIKSILMLQHGQVPPTITATPTELMPEVTQWIERGSLHISDRGTELPALSTEANAAILVSNRSLQRQNTAILVKRAPSIPLPAADFADERVSFPFVLTGKTARGLEQTRERFIDWLAHQGSEVSLSDLSMTMTVRRIAHPFRICFSASSVEEVVAKLRAAQVFEQVKATPALEFAFDAIAPSPGFEQLIEAWPTLGSAMSDIAAVQKALGISAADGLDAFIAQVAIAAEMTRCGLVPTLLAASGTGIMAALVISGSLGLTQALVVLASKKRGNIAPPPSRGVIGVPIHLSGTVTLPADAELSCVWDKVIDELVKPAPSSTGARMENAEWVQISTFTQLEADRTWKTLYDDLLDLYRRGAPLSFIKLHSDWIDQSKLVRTPPYAFDSSPYWIAYQDRNLIQTAVVLKVEDGETAEDDEEEDEVQSVADGPKAPRLPLLASCTSFVFDQEHASVEVAYETPIDSAPATALVRGHLVHGRGLVPATMWAEMALEVGHDLDWRTGDALSDNHAYDVRNLTIFNSLSIINDDPETYRELSIVVEAKGCLHRPEGLSITFKSRQGNGKLTDHLGCSLHRASESDWRNSWKKVEYLVQDRIDSIKDASSALGTRTAYRVFEVVVSYSKAYQGMRTVHLKHDTFEATTLAFQDSTAPRDGFIVNPCLMDSLGQITGFISNVAAEQKGSVFIANSIESMRFTAKFRQAAVTPGYTFRTYCKMSPVDDFMAGNMLVLDSGATEILACMNGVRFRRVPLRVLQIMLPHASKAKAATPAPAQSPRANVLAPTPVSPTDISFNCKAAAQGLQRPQPRPQQIAVGPDPVAATSRLWSSILDTIAGELGVGLAELESDTSLADMGLDSLMSMVIIGSLRNVLPTEIDLPNTLFLDHDTPAQLEGWLHSVAPSTPTSTAHGGISRASVASISSSLTNSSTTSLVKFSNASDSEMSCATSVSGDCASDQADMTLKPDAASTGVTSGGGRARQALEDTIEVLSCELGVDRAELSMDVELSSLGLDSLMSLVVIGTLQERLPFKIPSNAFLENDSLRELSGLYSKLEEEDFGPTMAAASETAPYSEAPQPAPAPIANPVAVKKPTLLQPGPDDIGAMFLAPDGSGSAAVYTTLPMLGRKVWGLNSPFYRNSLAWTGGMDQLARYYLDSIKLVQPKGPYILGGWSFGGIISYEMSRLLSVSADPNDRVTHLIMFDSPSPTRYPPLPISVTDWLFKSDVFKGITPPQLSPDMVEHFRQTVDGLAEYKPARYAAAEGGKPPPKAVIISAIQGLGKVEGVKEHCTTVDWLLESRASLGTGGWEELIPDIRAVTIEANHFDMMQRPKAVLLGGAIVDACRV